MESEIVEPIETVMQGLPGLEEMASNVNAGNSFINLTFAVGSDMAAMLVEVLSRMNRLQPLPRDVLSSKAAKRKSFFKPKIMTAWRNEVTSIDRPKPAELIKRSRLNDRVGSFFRSASISAVLPWLRTRLSSCMITA